jgi:hypothetical protein
MEQSKPSFCAVGTQVYKCSIGRRIPRKPLCVLRASCLGQVLGGSAPSCSCVCSCASKLQSAWEQLLAGYLGTFGKDLPQLPEGPQDAAASCCCLVFHACFEPCRTLCFSVFPHVSAFSCAQNNLRKSAGKGLISAFKNRKGINKKVGPVDKTNLPSIQRASASRYNSSFDCEYSTILGPAVVHWGLTMSQTLCWVFYNFPRFMFASTQQSRS